MEEVFKTLPSVINKLEPDEQTIQALVLGIWPRVAGDLVRGRTAAIRFADKNLEVAVPDETWRKNLTDLKYQFLTKLNKLLGPKTVKNIEFCINKKAVPKANLKLVRDIEINIRVPNDLDPHFSAALSKVRSETLRNQLIAAAYLTQSSDQTRVQRLQSTIWTYEK